MLSMGADILLSVDDPVPLSIAAIHGQLNMVKFLIKCDLTIINKPGPTDDKCTAIMGATIQGNTGIIKFLLTQPDLDPQKPSTYFSYFSWVRNWVSMINAKPLSIKPSPTEIGSCFRFYLRTLAWN